MTKKERLERQQQRQLKLELTRITKGLIANKVSTNDIKRKLKKQDVPAELVDEVVDSVLQKRRKEIKSEAMKNILIGGVFCFGGLGITLASIKSMEGGGGGAIAYGAVVLGGLQFLYGLYEYFCGR